MAADSIDAFHPADTLTDLLRGFKSDNLEERVAGLYEAHREELFRYLRARGVGAADAREICHEAFLRLFQALSRKETIRNARAWVFTVAHNCAVNASVSSRFSGELPSDAGAQIAGPGPNPEEQLLQKETLMRLHRAIGSLPPLPPRNLE